MNTLPLFFRATVLTLCITTLTPAQVGEPDLSELTPVSQLPQELPQRITGLAYDGRNLWATIYHGEGRYAKLNPLTLIWQSNNEITNSRAIAIVADPLKVLAECVSSTAPCGLSDLMDNHLVLSTPKLGR